MIQIALTTNATEIVRRLKVMPERMLAALKSAADDRNLATVGYIQGSLLTGQVLRVRTNRLRSSIRTVQAYISGNAVMSGIGTNVVYAGIHEFGGTIRRTTKPGAVRLRTDAGGQLLRGTTGGAIFAKASHKRARSVSYSGGHDYTITMPERSYIRRGIRENAEKYTRAFSNAIVRTWNGGTAA